MSVTTQSTTPATVPAGVVISTTPGDGGVVQVVQLPGTQAISGTVAVSGTVPVSLATAPTTPITAAALPLPAGASTETTLAAVNTKTPSLGQALAAASVPVVLPAAQMTTLTPLTSVGVNNFPATQAVSLATAPLPANAAQEASGNLAAIVAFNMGAHADLLTAILRELRINNELLQDGLNVPGDLDLQYRTDSSFLN